METDNNTCGVNIHLSLHMMHDDGWEEWVARDGFGFEGPCAIQFPVDLGLEVDDGEVGQPSIRCPWTYSSATRMRCLMRK